MGSNRVKSIVDKMEKFVPDRDFGRLGTTFETTNNKYFFDAGTGKAFACGMDEYNILKYMTENDKLYFDIVDNKSLDKICDAYEQIIDIIEAEHILQAPKYKEIAKMPDCDLQKLIEGDLRQVVLELTEKCNLRCKYCVYHEYNHGYRNFQNKDMDWNIAKRAIDYAYSHCGKEIAVTFYGGEPLVKFDLMKKCIEYSQALIKDKELSFSFTTNLTLMTPEIAKYIASVSKCSVLCSLDGPEIIHDSYRVGIEDKGTFKQVINGLKYLVEAMGDSAKERILINTVVCPPYTKEKLDMIQEFFDNIEWLPKELEKRCDYVEGGTLRNEDIAVHFLKDKNKNARYPSKNLDTIKAWALDKMINNEDENGYAAGINRNILIGIHNRKLSDTPISQISRNGCCIPGNRRIYVQTDGEFLVCEKIGDSPHIGNVFSGIDFEKIKQFYIDEYDNKSIENCSNCWAVNMCGICYSVCYGKDGLDMDKKDEVCEYLRKQAKGELEAYYQLLEDKPEEIQKIKDFSFK